MSFAKKVGSWAAQSKERMTAVRRRSVELLAEEMTNTVPNGGRVPFQTGNLARSLLASTGGIPSASDKLSTGSNVGAVTATLELDQPVWLGYQANYARRMNYGFVGADSKGRVYNQSGYHFVEGAIDAWPQLIDKAVSELKK